MKVLPKLRVISKANFCGDEFLGTTIMSREKKKKLMHHRLFISSIRCEIKHCHIIVMQ